MTGLPAHQKIGMPSLSPTMTEACALLKAMMIQTMLDLLLYAQMFCLSNAGKYCEVVEERG